MNLILEVNSQLLRKVVSNIKKTMFSKIVVNKKMNNNEEEEVE